MAICSAFSPILYNDVHVTGLPRNDFILADKKDLPLDMLNECEEIKNLKGDKKLIFYAPTFRNEQDKSAYKFSDQEIKKLKVLLEKNNSLLAIREHMATKNDNAYLEQLKSLEPLNMNNYNNIEMIYRNADVLITDYSSCFIDFMLTDKPIVNFSYDYDKYTEKERGLFYDMQLVFPNNLNKSFDEMIESLENSFDENCRTEHYKKCKNIFFKYTDNKNSKRVTDLIKIKLNQL
jgi:CDP-glycerol glycerophosphotransferase (TagB/SpsB family)